MVVVYITLQLGRALVLKAANPALEFVWIMTLLKNASFYMDEIKARYLHFKSYVIKLTSENVQDYLNWQ